MHSSSPCCSLKAASGFGHSLEEVKSCHAGSLLSTHVLLVNNPTIMPEYSGCLLRLATELGDRLLPAFNTPHGIPLSWVNLRRVSSPSEHPACAAVAACAGLPSQALASFQITPGHVSDRESLL